MRDLSGLSCVLTASSKEDRSLDQIVRYVGDDLEGVNTLILERINSQVEIIPKIAAHIVAGGGKRLRPLLTLASARMLGYQGYCHIALATCVEFIHTATLLHDDVIDVSALRRGRSSANVLWGNKASILVGDFLFAHAFQVIVANGSRDVLRILSDASATIAEGEVMQLAAAKDLDTTEATYFAVIEAKTACLFGAACEVGAVIADAPAPICHALDCYGRSLGMAFQITDDMLDYAPKHARYGKDVGEDFRGGKMTLPVLRAIQHSSESERAFWQRVLVHGDSQESDLDYARALMNQYHIADSVYATAREYRQKALAALLTLPVSSGREVLEALVDFVLDRKS